MEVPPLTLPAIVSVVAPCAAATEFVSDASYPGAPASKATGGVSAPVQSAGADVPSAADLGATRKAKKKEKKLRQKAGRQAQQQAEKETNEKVTLSNLVLRYGGATCMGVYGMGGSHPTLPYALPYEFAVHMHDCA